MRGGCGPESYDRESSLEEANLPELDGVVPGPGDEKVLLTAHRPHPPLDREHSHNRLNASLDPSSCLWKSETNTEKMSQEKEEKTYFPFHKMLDKYLFVTAGPSVLWISGSRSAVILVDWIHIWACGFGSRSRRAKMSHK
jgi:hypothetical protein